MKGIVHNYEWFCKHFYVPRETFDRLDIFHNLLKKWQQKINLISPADIDYIWERHILDSAQLKKYIPEDKNKITDLGSGAGFPGLILSLMGIKNIELIESDQRKVAFLQEAARVTDTEVTILNQRIESIKPLHKSDIITARACASLTKLLHIGIPLLKEHGIFCFQKGKNYNNEIDEAKKTWSFSVKTLPSITDPDARILIITEAKIKS